MSEKMKILHVDDDESIIEQSKIFLERENNKIEIHTTTSPSEALSKVQKEEYDAIISDYKMPELDGLEFLEKIRKERDDDVPFIIFTGRGREEIAMEALNIGADRYLRKGGDPSSQYRILSEAVSNTIERKEYKKRFRDFFENLPYMAFMIDPSGLVQEINKTFTETTGYDKDEIVGKPITDFSHLILEESLEKAVNKFTEFLREGEVDPFTIKYHHKNGETRFLEVNAVNMVSRSKIDRVIGIARDITEKKKRRENEKFLLSLLTHDLKNDFQVIKSYLEILEESIESEEKQETVSRIHEKTKNSYNILKKVKTLRKLEEIEKTKEVKIKPAIENSIKHYKEKMQQENINLEKDIQDCLVQAGPLLENLIQNLIENSIKHSNCSKIKIKNYKSDEECIVTIEDNGKGIKEQQKEEIFKKGYKNEKKGGAGLGMHLAKKIIETYNGQIKVKNIEKGGTRFKIHLKTKKQTK